MKKIFNAKIDKLLEMKKHLDSANELFLANIIAKNAAETIGKAVARYADLETIAKRVEKLKPAKGTRVSDEERKEFGDEVKNLMLTEKAFEAGISQINSTFDAYVKMTFQYNEWEVQAAYKEIRKRLNVKGSK